MVTERDRRCGARLRLLGISCISVTLQLAISCTILIILSIGPVSRTLLQITSKHSRNIRPLNQLRSKPTHPRIQRKPLFAHQTSPVTLVQPTMLNQQSFLHASVSHQLETWSALLARAFDCVDPLARRESDQTSAVLKGETEIA